MPKAIGLPNLSIKNKESAIHIFLWIVYYLINIGIAYASDDFIPSLPLLLLPFLAIEIGYFYFSLLFGFPNIVLNERRGWIAQVGVTISYLLFYTLYYQYYGWVLNTAEVNYWYAFMMSLYSLIFDFIIILGVFYYKLSIAKLKEVTKKEIEIAQKGEVMARLELAEFKSIFNSHITYNTLQYVYAKVLHDPDINKPILLLADFLRYGVDKFQEDTVSLELEVQHIHNFINIHKLISPSLQIDFNVSGNLKNTYLLGRILINYIENALKHGVRNDPHYPIKIHLHVEDQIHLRIQNKVRKVFIKKAGGTGSMITKKALNTYYQDKYLLEIQQTEKEYFLHLSIPFQKKHSRRHVSQLDH